MYEIINQVIAKGGYKLEEIRHKVKKLFIYGDLTEAQTDELLEKASEGISADAERPEFLQMLSSLGRQVEALEQRLAQLEGGEIQTGYPVWKAWDGISQDYGCGAVVSHNGSLWKSVFDGQNVWEPGAAGTENLWVAFKEE